MSRTGTYWSDHNGRLNCAHGVLLHGTNCVQCERGDLPEPAPFIKGALDALRAKRYASGGFVPKTARTMGFDTASGPDHHVEIEMTRRRAGETYRYTVDDIRTSYEFRQAMNGDDDRMAEMRARYDAAAKAVMDDIAARAGGRDYYRMPDPPWDFGDAARKRWEHSRGDPRPRPEHYSCRSTIDPHWGDGTPLTDAEIDLINGRYRDAEIITDPNDTRGVNARRVGPGA